MKHHKKPDSNIVVGNMRPTLSSKVKKPLAKVTSLSKQKRRIVAGIVILVLLSGGLFLALVVRNKPAETPDQSNVIPEGDYGGAELFHYKP